MLKVLFLIHDLGQGGAEKVLVNLVNNMDRTKFDITVMTLFSGGVNEQFLAKDIKYKTVYKRMIRGNSKLMKLLSPETLHKMYIKEKYDIEISFLEGPCARIISGCKNSETKKVSWIHVEQHTLEALATSFRNKDEAINCYNKFDRVICVSDYVRNDFSSILDYQKPCDVLYNTIESEKILELSKQPVNIQFDNSVLNLIAVGTLKKSKGYDRMLSVVNRLTAEGIKIHLYILGIGYLQTELEQFVERNNLEKVISFVGYDVNPYRYVARADLFICTSHSEGFSTAATESLIVGTPVCTVEVSGMKEMLGENNEFGVVTDNDEFAFYNELKTLLNNPELLQHYKEQAKIRGSYFSKKKTVRAVEAMLESL